MNKKPIVKVGLLSLVLCLALVVPGCGVCGFGPGQVLIRDAQLELALRHALERPFGCITKADMLTLTDLDASAYNIRNLDGIEAAKNLVNLDLDSNYIDNLGPLRDLDKLTNLDLSFNLITVIEPISSLDSLRVIDFTCNNDIKDWDPMAAVVTTNNGFLEGGTILFDKHASTVDCSEAAPEGEVCYTDSFASAANAIHNYAVSNGVEIDILLGVPVGDNTRDCLE